jgi:uncharacterized protein (DUF1684 family)
MPLEASATVVQRGLQPSVSNRHFRPAATINPPGFGRILKPIWGRFQWASGPPPLRIRSENEPSQAHARRHLLSGIALGAYNPVAMPATYIQSIEEWRREMDARLRQPDSWLTLAGLFWLEPRDNDIGTNVQCAVRLPSTTLPEHMGNLRLEGERVSWSMEDSVNVPVRVDGRISRRAVLRSDLPGPASRLTLEAFTLIIIRRGQRCGVRLWNNDRRARQDFPGRIWFPISLDWRMPASFHPLPPEHRIAVPNRLGEETEETVPGMATFEVEGSACQLQALNEPGGRLRLIFADPTNGRQTYPAGRYLITEPPVGQQVWLDFNRAYNPPCAFSPYATCSLPPALNHLTIAINAGERYVPSFGAREDAVSHP